MRGDENRPVESWLSDGGVAFWARMPGWKAREAAALLLGLDPDENLPDSERSRYERLKKLLLRAQKVKQIRMVDRPRNILEWAFANDLPIPEPLKSRVEGGKRVQNWRKIARKRLRVINELQAELADPSKAEFVDLPARSKASIL